MDVLRLEALPEEHARLLSWFLERAGTQTRYPDPLEDGSLLVSRPKGIYKPKGWDHALSVRINLDSRYQDGDVHYRPDGTWYFAYHQEGDDLEHPESEYTNRALLRCIDDGVPVGVLREIDVPSNRPVMYDVQGLAVPTTLSQGYFHFEGFSTGGYRHLSEPSRGALLSADLTTDLWQGPKPNPTSDQDARIKTLREIVTRRGQNAFRQQLLDVYSCTCAITGTRVEAVLEAAHLRPYRGEHTNDMRNGLPLRADIHTLLDLRLLAIHPETRRVVLSPALLSSGYKALEGRQLLEPRHESAAPSVEALNWVWTEFLAQPQSL